MDQSPPAFPVINLIEDLGDGWLKNVVSPGMSLRDYFATQALAGLLADPQRDGGFDLYAYEAYRYADAMLEARKESEN